MVDQHTPGKRFKLSPLARRIGANITPACHGRWQLVAANAAHANRRLRTAVQVPKRTEFGERQKVRLAVDLPLSVATSRHLIPDCSGVNPKVWAFRVAILRLGRRDLVGQHVGRIWSWIGPVIALMAAAMRRPRCIMSLPGPATAAAGRRNFNRARNCMLDETSAGMASAFNALADEQSTAPYYLRLVGSYPKKLRSTANPERASASCWNRTCDGSNWGDACPLGNRLSQVHEYLRLLPICALSAVGLPNMPVAIV